jgi:ABC-type multidrug transport system fused ATPase/permease subunit
VTSFGGDPAIGYGVLIFLGFFCLAIFQGISEYSWQTLGYKIQHDLRMDATRSLIAMEASYYDMRQTGQIMSVLSSDVNQLEGRCLGLFNVNYSDRRYLPYCVSYSRLHVMETRHCPLRPNHFDCSHRLLVLNKCTA